MDLMVNPVITDFQQDVNGDIKMLKIGANKEDAYANIQEQVAGDVENNKTATIDVSTYTQAVEIKPTAGKTSMKKATVTLSNIPSPSGVTTLYAWENESQNSWMYTITETPTTSNKALFSDDNTNMMELLTITEVTEEGIKTSRTNDVYARYSAGDISLT